MAEMDIYMRRRLVALGGLVAFFIIFVLLVKSCGGDDEPASPSRPPPQAPAARLDAALTPELFIEEADGVCGPANLQVSDIDPEATDAAQQEYLITREELKALQQLQLAENSQPINKFLNDLSAVVTALQAKAQAEKSGDVAAEDAAQLEIDTAEVDARAAGEDAGFSECGQFLDAGETPTGGGGGGGGDAATTDTGGGSRRQTPPCRPRRTRAPRRPRTTAPPHPPRTTTTAAAESPPRRPVQPRRRRGARTRRPPRSTRRAFPPRRSSRARAPRSSPLA